MFFAERVHLGLEIFYTLPSIGERALGGCAALPLRRKLLVERVRQAIGIVYALFQVLNRLYGVVIELCREFWRRFHTKRVRIKCRCLVKSHKSHGLRLH